MGLGPVAAVGWRSPLPWLDQRSLRSTRLNLGQRRSPGEDIDSSHPAGAVVSQPPAHFPNKPTPCGAP